MLQKHQSRPLWARELKLKKEVQQIVLIMSRPLWARELKLRLINCCMTVCVAPPVGA